MTPQRQQTPRHPTPPNHTLRINRTQSLLLQKKNAPLYNDDVDIFDVDNNRRIAGVPESPSNVRPSAFQLWHFRIWAAGCPRRFLLHHVFPPLSNGGHRGVGGKTYRSQLLYGLGPGNSNVDELLQQGANRRVGRSYYYHFLRRGSSIYADPSIIILTNSILRFCDRDDSGGLGQAHELAVHLSVREQAYGPVALHSSQNIHVFLPKTRRYARTQAAYF